MPLLYALMMVVAQRMHFFTYKTYNEAIKVISIP
jgi:hypothetical protein